MHFTKYISTYQYIVYYSYNRLILKDLMATLGLCNQKYFSEIQEFMFSFVFTCYHTQLAPPETK